MRNIILLAKPWCRFSVAVPMRNTYQHVSLSSDNAFFFNASAAEVYPKIMRYERYVSKWLEVTLPQSYLAMGEAHMNNHLDQACLDQGEGILCLLAWRHQYTTRPPITSLDDLSFVKSTCFDEATYGSAATRLTLILGDIVEEICIGWVLAEGVG